MVLTINEAMLLSDLPKLDLHGETRDVSCVLINDFINDCIKQKIQYAEIIFGNGAGILRSATYDTLKKNKYVKDFKSPYNNRGSVIIIINLTK